MSACQGLLLVYFICFQSITSALQIRASISPRASVNCKEVLVTQNLECPNIGSFPVAGHCDYFARCIQTENGVESEVDFCPDGHIYVVNRCKKSHNVNDCPQKRCEFIPTVTNAPAREPTTPKQVFPIPVTATTNVGTSQFYPPKLTTRRPLSNLHPSRNDAMCDARVIGFYQLLLSALVIIMNKLF